MDERIALNIDFILFCSKKL